ncbi:MAG: molecular chaperone HtpG [Syntrophorhabdus aromaticivorans]|uniref:Chaperone protein HtpG n=1 Tax=Syntrophorhabdus aromaticivorans TaxID=328301 RepID=A0A971S1P6_9BACT|nr:molecular chaperone HtpG [Syntrophorhabdus aromaticivorans]
MTVEKMEFKTEVKQLLDLMIHSLYSHKEVFLRELVSNASDAIDRAKYESLTNQDIAENDGAWRIKIITDEAAGTLTVSDNGIGMTKDEAIQALGTIARSGTKEFLQALQQKEIKDNPELIGQFGVGFYSSFMVADKVTVISRKAGQNGNGGVKWESTGDGSFTVEDVDKAGKGTDVILHLNRDERKYLKEWEIKDIIRRYSDFIEHPIVMDVEREKQSEIDKTQRVRIKEEETLNSMKAIWLRDKGDIPEEEYNEFYKHIAHDFTNPAKVIHYKAEGTSEFAALLYIPGKAPFNILYKDYKMGPALYVRRVQIMDHCEELLPPYLRFVKGVVDSSDLPLNVSREILQNNRQIDLIKTNLTKKVLDTLADMKRDENDKYLEFYKEFGRVIKEGIHYDFARGEAIADLLLFPSTRTGESKLRTLQEYVEGMKDDQQEIYYAGGTSVTEILKSPYMEAFSEKDYEVLVMVDDIDDFIFSGFEYKGKKMKSILKGDIHLDKKADADQEKVKKEFDRLIELIKDHLKDHIKDVRFSGRLTGSACCLVADEHDMDPQMEKLLKTMGQDVPAAKRILEINPNHPLFAAMNTVFEKDKNNPILKEFIQVLYDQALLLEGSKPKDPGAFTRIVTTLMVENLEKNLSA